MFSEPGRFVARSLQAMALLSLLASGSASAAIVALCSGSQTCTVSGPVIAGQTTRVKVVWRGSLLSETGESPISLSSSSGNLFAGSQSLLSVSSPLSVSRAAAGDQAVNVNIEESLTIPGSATEEARAAGVKSLVYQRLFRDSEGQVRDGQVTINLAPPAPDSEPGPVASGLEITGLTLRFANGSQTRVIQPGANVTAMVTMSYRNVGLLQARWELATPASTQGEPVFVPVRQVRQNLGSGRQILLQSPRLPSNAKGLYLLRFRVLGAGNEVAPLTIQYMVGGQGEREAPSITRLEVQAPEAEAVLGPDTRFHWQSLPGAVAYQLEFYNRTADRPASTARDGARSRTVSPAELALPKPLVTGLLVPGDTSSLTLTAMAGDHLTPGQTFLWRVLAVDAEGLVVGASQLRSVSVP